MLDERIAQFAKAYYGSKKKFAETLEMTPQGLSAYGDDKRKPGFDVLERFYEAGMSIDWLISGKGAPTAANYTGRKLAGENDGIISNVAGISTSKTRKVASLKNYDELKTLMKEALSEALNENHS